MAKTATRLSKAKRRSKTPPKLLIKNFGILWSASLVNWGGAAKKGALEGVSTRSKKVVANFRDQIAIYVLYDSSLKPIYIGQSGSGKQRLFARLKQHRSDHLEGRWDAFSWFGLRSVNNNGTLSGQQSGTQTFVAKGDVLLDQFESILLAAAEPSLNKQGPKWRGAQQYKQQRPKPGDVVSLADLSEAIDEIRENTNRLAKSIAKPSSRRRR